VQFWRYFTSVLQGDLGTSLQTKQPIARDLRTYLPATMELVFAPCCWRLWWAFRWACCRAPTKAVFFDHLTRLVSISGVSIPTFWLGLLLQLFFFSQLKILPLGSRIFHRHCHQQPVTQLTGFYLIDNGCDRQLGAFKDTLLHPGAARLHPGHLPVALAIRMTRSNIIEVLSEKYILAARITACRAAPSCSTWRSKTPSSPPSLCWVFPWLFTHRRHLDRNHLFVAGLGSYITGAVLAIDFPVIVSVTLFVTVIYVFIN
jgi:peptide/nickel transport system permease protein